MKLTRLIRLSLAGLPLLLLPGCDALKKIDGRVVDEAGQPIEAATIWLIYDDWSVEAHSKANGTFQINEVYGSGDELTLLVSKPGRSPYYQLVDKKIASKELVITLHSGSQLMLETLDRHR